MVIAMRRLTSTARLDVDYVIGEVPHKCGVRGIGCVIGGDSPCSVTDLFRLIPVMRKGGVE